jgi:hypothetical protein
VLFLPAIAPISLPGGIPFGQMPCLRYGRARVHWNASKMLMSLCLGNLYHHHVRPAHADLLKGPLNPGSPMRSKGTTGSARWPEGPQVHPMGRPKEAKTPKCHPREAKGTDACTSSRSTAAFESFVMKLAVVRDSIELQPNQVELITRSFGISIFVMTFKLDVLAGYCTDKSARKHTLHVIIILGGGLFTEKLWAPSAAKASSRRPLCTPSDECASHGEGRESQRKRKINGSVF